MEAALKIAGTRCFRPYPQSTQPRCKSQDLPPVHIDEWPYLYAVVYRESKRSHPDTDTTPAKKLGTSHNKTLASRPIRQYNTYL